MEDFGKNVKVSVDAKGIVTITFDSKKNLGLSASGKSNIVATTSGNKALPGTDIVIGFNAYKRV